MKIYDKPKFEFRLINDMFGKANPAHIDCGVCGGTNVKNYYRLHFCKSSIVIDRYLECNVCIDLEDNKPISFGNGTIGISWLQYYDWSK